LAARGASRLAYHFEGSAPPGFDEPLSRTCRQYRNPVALAREWQGMLATGECASRAKLARRLGVSRPRVTQVLGLLDLAPDVVDALAALGDPLPRPIVTEHGLRSILRRPAEEQRHALRRMVDEPV
jgi:hypothetical protein